MTALPLSGIVVVDLTRHRAGPVTSRLLGDWGAEIIKIEEPTDIPYGFQDASRRQGNESLGA
ncbi:CoA transferase [Photorhabdus luminescens]|uniref:CoA transferase n=1 Tax=Photorhabdus luminescens subsp. sonorensis TaxID=1173677 RepID=A0A5C4RER0_PHOLU|nr:CoA transferase [Photorhabdus luminescens]TNH42426.1 hypothetical protein EP164_17135 [Photorhabdus luminescens subsp. sonorensis]